MNGRVAGWVGSPRVATALPVGLPLVRGMLPLCFDVWFTLTLLCPFLSPYLTPDWLGRRPRQVDLSWWLTLFSLRQQRLQSPCLVPMYGFLAPVWALGAN